jgi:DNA-binding XRE family transcriptional regulator
VGAWQEKYVAKVNIFADNPTMPKTELLAENELAALAKGFRKKAGKSRAQAAREMRVSQTSIFNAEESPAQSLLKLRVRMIEAYSPFKVVGPVFHLRKKSR